jgi:iron complex outermembrane receptor protein
MNISQLRKRMLEASVAVPAIALLGAGFATPAYAQDDVCDPATETCAEADEGPTIVVTGSLFRRTNTETASPVTSLSAETLEERGINTAAEAVQRIPSNNAGTIQQGWNTGFNFASGANAPALRGLTVQSTLSIIDGVRMAPYPLADDGQRNFVDLNTIPNAIIERIEILRDGASSTYGSDAIAGVINVITKKEIQGLHLNGSYGMSQEGDADEFRADATWGYGDLDEDGFNFYISGEWQKQDALFARDREYPFNSNNWTGICSPDTGSCMHNLNWNGYSPEDGLFNGLISTPGVALVRRGSLTTTTTGTGRFQYLNPSAGCEGWPVNTQTGTSGTAPLSGACEVDFQNAYIMLQPEIERRGVSGRVTFKVADRHEVYAQVNWYNTLTNASFTPLGLNGTPTPPNNGVAAYNVMLPVYVCPTGVGTLNGLNTGCTAANGVLNPQNPFAAEGRTAQLFLRHHRGRTVETDTRALRGVLGAEGEFGNGFFYTANFTASEMKLRRDQGNYFIPQRIADAAAQGLIDFRNWESNPESVFDMIAPLNSTVSTTDLWQVQATVAKELFELPGGPLNVAVGAAYREESIDAPSANPAVTGNQYERYYSINSVGTAGSRNVKSAFFEVDAPVLDMLELSFSGRYDDYSTGQSNFSPKAGVKFTPIPEIAIRGTWSKGFRVPSFNEAFGLPTTGYITQGGTPAFCTTNATFCAAHGNNAYATQAFPVGLTSVGNPALEPEKSTAFTAGVIIEPIRNVSFTVDFWHIKVKNLIGPPGGQGAAIAQYYANNGVVTVPGYTAIPGTPDPAFPNALPHIGFLQSSFTNQDSQVVSGLDFALNISTPVTDNIRLRSVAEASWLMKYELTRDTGTVERYEGTLSPCNITSCSGAPEWRATWQNSLDIFEDTTLSLTAYYTDGYGTESVDFGAVRGDCDSGINNGSTATYADGTPVNCHQSSAWNVDFNARHKINDMFTVYLDVLNVLDLGADFDPSAAYGLFGFNPAWQGPNILGRYFRVGAKVDF